MGIDYLDIVFRIEKRLNVRIGRHDHPWPQTRGVHDITAGHLADWAARLWKNKTLGTKRRIGDTL